MSNHKYECPNCNHELKIVIASASEWTKNAIRLSSAESIEKSDD